MGAVSLQPGLVSIFTYLSAHGIAVEVLDLSVELDTPRVPSEAPAVAAEALDMVLARDFDLLAISCNSSFHYLGCLDLATGVRAADPDVPIVVGGCHTSAVPGDFTSPDSPFDVVVQGEGELELLDLARTLRGRPDNTQVRVGRPLPLDRIYADFTGYPYWHERPHNLTFSLSRGCPFTCTFCGKAERSAWRAYPPKLALTLIEKMVAAGPEVIRFADPCFGLRPEWRREVLKGLVAMAPSQAFHLLARIESLSDEDVDLLGGLDVAVSLGLEAVSPRMVKLMRKASDGDAYLDRAQRLLVALGRRQVVTHVLLILNHPGETPESLAETLAFGASLGDDPGLSAYATAYALMLLPGTAISNEIDLWRAQGASFAHPRWWYERQLQRPLAADITTGVTRQELDFAINEMVRLRTRAIKSMPASARLTWRRIAASLPRPNEAGGPGRPAGPKSVVETARAGES